MAEFSLFRKRKLILKYSPLSIALEVLALAALIAGLLVVDRWYPGLPETVPAKFAADGSVADYGVKELTLLHPILATFVYIIFFCVNIIARQSCPPDRPLPVLETVLDAMTAARILFLAGQSLATWYAVHLLPVPGWLTWATLAALALTAAVAAALIRRRKARQA